MMHVEGLDSVTGGDALLQSLPLRSKSNTPNLSFVDRFVARTVRHRLRAHFPDLFHFRLRCRGSHRPAGRPSFFVTDDERGPPAPSLFGYDELSVKKGRASH